MAHTKIFVLGMKAGNKYYEKDKTLFTYVYYGLSWNRIHYYQ